MGDRHHAKQIGNEDVSIAHDEVETFIEEKDECLNDGLGSRWKFWKRKRYSVVVMVFLGEITKLLLRSNLAIAVFPMTEKYISSNENGTEIYVQDFDWDVKTRGFILSVFYYGYVSTSLLGAVLALMYGAGKLYGLGIILASITTLFTPVIARTHLYLFVAIRIFEGMCEGVLNPCGDLLLSRWIPAEERSSSVAVTVSGHYWGHVIGIAMSSWIGSHWGWEAIFYCTGIVGVVWFGAWLILVREHPMLDKNISLSELTYIQKSTRRSQQIRSKISSVPYVNIITSEPVWALTVSYIACSWTYIISVTHSAAYIKDVLKLDYQNSGYLSSLPFIISALTSYIVSPIADILTTRNVLTFTVTRKIYLSGGFMIIAGFSFVIQHATSATYVVACLIIMQIFITACSIQNVANIIDIAPKYSSILGGLTCTMVSVCGIIAPTLTGYLTQNKAAEEWHTVFSIQSGVCLLAAILYGVYGSGMLQTWADEGKHATLKGDTRASRTDLTTLP